MVYPGSLCAGFPIGVALPSITGHTPPFWPRCAYGDGHESVDILASTTAILTSLFGLLSIGMVAAFPTIIYSGFLDWLELPLWQRLLLHAPLALLVSGVGFLALNVPA